MQLIKSFRKPAEDNKLLTGLILLGISFLVFAATMRSQAVGLDLFSQAFFINYGSCVAYFVVLLIHNKQAHGAPWRFRSLPHNLLLLQLANISAYSLNRTIPVFQISTDWLVNYLLIYNIALLLFVLRRDRHPDSINLAILFIVASGLVFQLYETLYTLPLYGIGVAACWFFGISLHIFIPLWFFISSILVVRTHLRASSRYRPILLIGLAVPLVLISLVSIRWAGLQRVIAREFEQVQAGTELPAWVRLSRDLPRDWVSERILKSGVVYQVADLRNFEFIPGDNLLNERRQHDPLVVTASAFGGNLDDLPLDDRLALLRAVFDQRHQTERRLWRGENLRTADIATSIELFPDYRLAYTEKIVTIHNDLKPEQWRTTQEALYTFQLPEGSVVTSAALWIAGEERPAYLTTKEKADSAYATIVGRERRDPLLVHWQEGNRVTVRVFPCTPEEDRQFKIGVTSPLQLSAQGELTYHNIDFVGPDWRQARETIRVTAKTMPAKWRSSIRFRETEGAVSYRGRYRSDWRLRFPAPALAQEVFAFNGRSFAMAELAARGPAFTPLEFYLDVNQSWSKGGLKRAWEQLKDQEVYVFTDRLERVTEANHQALFRQLRKRHYSLFPLHHIRRPEKALIITAGGALSPTLDDLSGSTFAESLNAYMAATSEPVRMLHLGPELSPYWKSLRELRVVDYIVGTQEDLSRLPAAGPFYGSLEDDRNLVNVYAGARIHLKPDSLNGGGNAPDHLMRLFVYNDLMRTIGKNYFERAETADQLVDQAREAHVLSPVSSLIVLETQEDYERFDIKKSKDSLHNASLSDAGSVPEPHEWVLISFSILLACWLLRKDIRARTLLFIQKRS